MNKKQLKKLNKEISKIMWYAVYVDSFNRILNELIQNGIENLKPRDVANLSELNTIYSSKLHKKLSKFASILEFGF